MNAVSVHVSVEMLVMLVKFGIFHSQIKEEQWGYNIWTFVLLIEAAEKI